MPERNHTSFDAYFGSCRVCEARPRPLARRSTMLPQSTQFDMAVGTDLLLPNCCGQQVWCSNANCWTTGLQVVSRLTAGKTSKETRMLVTVYGWPYLASTD